MNNGNFDFNLFLKESKELLTSPNGFFSTQKLSGGFGEPIIKAVIYGAISGLIVFIWSLLHLGTITGGFPGGSIGIMTFIYNIIGAIIALFVGGLILLIISSICNGSTDFEANIRVTSAIMVLMPVAAFAGFTGSINPLFSSLASLAINIFGLWLLYNALIDALKAKPESAKIAMYILAAIFVLYTLVSYTARQRVNESFDTYNNTELTET
jgi:hypothetical protein